ncbi:hypothetical protein PTSG_07634 [Salpingoeca rosetta]|uniref:Uncharacterized protein n=1 Tax=Salpingoeca rosetta (strain ATCC 50818 / BSB-021) TaxID=946362 RepID=F2UHB8_SALR5|nr:uncharacterized protein PTSG_07634 [Salpingoeca rosetta]EGD76517.1 hypothetical protein PTSG_07634 [Salpingoeca rosetta]|eukprot:XP_004991431.1 hypothetical protein PTSG_07634 [Salpingoeca rosetta]
MAHLEMDDVLSAVELPGPLDREALAQLSTEEQANVVASLTDRNVFLAQHMSTLIDHIVNPAQRQSQQQQQQQQQQQHQGQPQVQRDWPRLIRALQTDPTQPLEQQYEDFGLWRAVQRASDRAVKNTKKALKSTQQAQAQHEQQATGEQGGHNSNDDANDGDDDDDEKERESLRDLLVQSYGDEMAKLQTDSKLKRHHIPLLINTLDMGMGLLTDEEKAMLASS